MALQIALGRPGVDPNHPLAVVKDDQPSAPVVQLNRVARGLGLVPGTRYSEALTVVPRLKGLVVSSEDRRRGRQEIMAVLDHWSPRVEVCDADPDCFWVDPTGLERLFGPEERWGSGVRAALAQKGYRAVVIVGRTRLGTYVLARSRGRSTLVKTASAEDRAVVAAPLAVFPLLRKHLHVLHTLGITTWGDLLALPPDEVARRWGDELFRTVRRLSEWASVPVQHAEVAEGLTARVTFDPAVTDGRRLALALQAPLDDALTSMVNRGQVMAELRLVFVDETGVRTEVLRPARPTAQGRLWHRLLGLRLTKLVWTVAVVEVRLGFQTQSPGGRTEDWFDAPVSRNPRAASEALAMVRALGGPDAVVRSVLANSHVPERSYRWEPTDGPGVPRPREQGHPTAVRRVWWNGGRGNPAGRRIGGPYRLQTTGDPVVDREYWFLRSATGEVAWVSHDKSLEQTTWEGVVD